MTSKDLIDELHIILKKNKVSVSKTETKEIFDTVIDVIKSNLINGKTITISEFATIETKMRRCQDPQNTSSKMDRWVISFKTAFSLKKKLNEKRS